MSKNQLELCAPNSQLLHQILKDFHSRNPLWLKGGVPYWRTQGEFCQTVTKIPKKLQLNTNSCAGYDDKSWD